ncbi:acyl-CoA dehydrogenase family protein [Gordonia sp. NPDC003950]
MDFTLDEATLDIAGLARDIASKVSTDERVAELEAAGRMDDVLWRELGAAGLLALELSADAVDVDGLSIVESVTVAEQLGRALARVPFGTHAVAALPVLAKTGSSTLRESLLAAAATGKKILTVAFEEELGADVRAPQATLSRNDSRWVLSGTKVNVPYAAESAAILVNAVSDDGVRVVAVASTAPGVGITDTPVTGKTPTFIVDFDSVVIDDDHVLAGGGDTVAEVADRMTLAVCADQSGTVSRAMELTASYAVEREQFGRAIGSFQAVAQRLADGYIDAQGLSLTTTQAAWLFARADDLDDGDDVGMAIATAKFWACDAGHRVAHTAVHVHGGVGLDTTHPAHRYFLRAKQNEFTMGSAPVVLESIGAGLASAPA